MPAGLPVMLGKAGIVKAQMVSVTKSYLRNSVEGWWLIAKGSGYCGTLAQLAVATLTWARKKDHAPFGQFKAIIDNVR